MMIKATIKMIIKNGNQSAYYHRHKKAALKAIQNIHKYQGLKLDKRNKKKCDTYAQETFGSKKFAPWLYVYTLLSGRFKEGWIPPDYYGHIVVKNLKGDYGKVVSLRSLNMTIFQSSLFPDLLSYVNGLYFDYNYNCIPIDQVKNYLFRNEDSVVVYKLDSSVQGVGICFFNKDSFNSDLISSLGNGVFQRYIDQHDFFSEFNRKAVATVRITSVSADNGDVSIRGAYLRLARDNELNVKYESEIKIPIDINTGVLADVGYTPDWCPTEMHPDSKVLFKGKTIPKFDACITAVNNLHRKIPYVRCLGWDLVVNKQEEVVVIECNGGDNSIMFSEVTQGPCFSDLGWEKLSRKV